MMPNCLLNPSTSTSPQRSYILPLATRNMSIPVTVTLAPVGGDPHELPSMCAWRSSNGVRP